MEICLDFHLRQISGNRQQHMKGTELFFRNAKLTIANGRAIVQRFDAPRSVGEEAIGKENGFFRSIV